MSDMRRIVIQRVVAGVRVNEFGCWIWQGATDSRGYGRISIHNRRSCLAHRVAYEAFVGKCDDELELDHLCRNPSCVNPWHLEPVTHEENVRRGSAGAVNGARMHAKTHCKYGHPYTSENTRIDTRGARVCRTCQRNWTRRRREAK